MPDQIVDHVRVGHEHNKNTELILEYPKVAIIILNWNNKDDTINCLQSLEKLDYPNYKIIVVDNGSTDGSQDTVKKQFPDVKLIELDKNYGFAKGNNIGIREAFKDKEVKYIFALNNDTVVHPNCFREMVRVAESDERIGMVQPKVYRMNLCAVFNGVRVPVIDTTGHIIRRGIVRDRGQGHPDIGQYDDKTDDIIGACACACLYKREMLEDVGLFDESFITYYEDAELSWRAHKKGWKAKFVPNAIVWHKRKGTMKKLDVETRRKIYELSLRNMVTVVKRHGNFYQKFTVGLWLIKTGICSAIGYRVGKNIIGGAPYFRTLRRLVLNSNTKHPAI